MKTMDDPVARYEMMVVDDEPLMTAYLLDAIPRIRPDWVVAITAKDGTEALEMLRKRAFDLVLTDIAMPEMDGLELASQIQAAYPQTLVVILSGFDEFDFARKAVRYGVFEYLLKPLDDQELGQVLQRVSDHLQSRGGRQQVPSVQAPQAEERAMEPITLVEKSIAYIHSHFQEPISLSDIARSLDISASYLSDIFHKTTGEPYCKFITKVRMEKAAETFRQNRQIKVYIVSKKVGYLSTKHFNVVFKKYFGLTPMEYYISCKRP